MNPVPNVWNDWNFLNEWNGRLSPVLGQCLQPGSGVRKVRVDFERGFKFRLGFRITPLGGQQPAQLIMGDLVIGANGQSFSVKLGGAVAICRGLRPLEVFEKSAVTLA